MRSPIVFAAAAILSAANAQNWEIDPRHSTAQFSVRHMVISNVRGEFLKVGGSATYDPKNLKTANLEATIDVSSITTRDEKRDAHLKGPDFFDVAKFPTITFKSRSFSKTSAGLKILGDLTMHGVTKPVTLTVEGPSEEIKDSLGKQRIGASATLKVNRKEFGINYSKVLETGGVIVGDEVLITLDVQLVKK